MIERGDAMCGILEERDDDVLLVRSDKWKGRIKIRDATGCGFEAVLQSNGRKKFGCAVRRQL